MCGKSKGLDSISVGHSLTISTTKDKDKEASKETFATIFTEPTESRIVWVLLPEV